MRRTITRTAALGLLTAAIGALAADPVFGVEYFLRAEAFTRAMPDGREVTMWGWAQDSAFGVPDGTPSSPGPTLVVPPGDTTLTIHVDNNLPGGRPVSLVIPGLKTAMTRVLQPPAGDNAAYAGRVRSLTHETPAGNTAPVSYTWTDVRPGTYLYHSGTHMQVQVQMGLYGAVTKDQAAGQAYPGVPYNTQVVIFFSEVDPALHDAVAANDYGPGKGMTSTVGYDPKYFLITVNGVQALPGDAPIPVGAPGGTVLLRFVNAGIQTRSPNTLGLTMTVHAEDAFPYPYSQMHHAIGLEALKTKDATVTPASAGVFPIYDRAVNATSNAVPNQTTVLAIEAAP
jgi:FtsP/CotA-like multicopper oxidase with cupredoxin domain